MAERMVPFENPGRAECPSPGWKRQHLETDGHFYGMMGKICVVLNVNDVIFLDPSVGPKYSIPLLQIPPSCAHLFLLSTCKNG